MLLLFCIFAIQHILTPYLLKYYCLLWSYSDPTVLLWISLILPKRMQTASIVWSVSSLRRNNIFSYARQHMNDFHIYLFLSSFKNTLMNEYWNGWIKDGNVLNLIGRDENIIMYHLVQADMSQEKKAVEK